MQERLLTICRLRSIQLIAGVLGRAGQSGQKKRKEAAKSGKVEWETAGYVREWIEESPEIQAEIRKRAMTN
jgi:small subunit ribosomal protein S2